MTLKENKKDFIQKVNAAIKLAVRSDKSQTEIERNIYKSIDILVDRYMEEEDKEDVD
tara:strand:+ start:344 stop:514 length:171 start_codon:yes stop_codon:yes gene_type:complete